MPTYKTKGIIIRRKNFGETDRMLTIYTKNHGKIRVIAKGVRKTLSKLGGHLELFYFVDLILAEGKNLDIITSAQIIDSHKNIRYDKNLINQTYYISELVDLATKEGAENKEIFQLIKECLDSFNIIPDRKVALATVSSQESNNGLTLVDSCFYRNDNYKHEKILRYFELKLIYILGFYPEINTCVVCKKRLEYKHHGFSYARGGIICSNCNNQGIKKISPETIKFTRLILSKNWNFIKRIKMDSKIPQELKIINQEILDYILEREIKSRKFL